MFTKHNLFYCEKSNIRSHYLPWRHHQMEKGDRRSSGLQNWQAEAPVTGCQFIGHHLVSQTAVIVSARRTGTGTGTAALRVHVVPGGSLQVTALPLEHTYSFHMELLLHPACTRRLRTDTTFRSEEVTFKEVLEICAIWNERRTKAKQTLTLSVG